LGLERSQAAAALGISAAGALGVWFLVVAFLAVATRTKDPEPQPAGLEFGGDEPPAIVNMLASGWKVRGEAMSSTLVDLAARHIIDFERETDGRLLVRLGKDPTGLTRYERQVLDLVREQASNGVVPVDALTPGTEEQVTAFHKSFAKAVTADARRRGLSRSRWSRAMTAIVGVAAVAPALLAAGALVALPDAHGSSSSSDDNPVAAFIGIALFGWVALMALFHALRADRDTPEGLSTAGRWLGLRENLEADGTFPSLPPTAVAIWDRYLAYAVALGVAATTERSIPLGAESDTEAWSSLGGRWRVVRIRYPRRVPPGWGRAPWKNILAGLFSAAIAGTIGWFLLPAMYDAQSDLLKNATAQDHRIALGVSIGLAVIAFAIAVAMLRGVWMFVLGASDLGRGRTIEGRVLRVRNRNQRTYVAVDDGTDDHVAAWVTTAAARQGVDVRITVATHVGYVRHIDVVGAQATAPSETPLADLFSGPAAASATPLTLDPAWVSSLIGVDVHREAGTLLQGPDGLAIGGVTLTTGAAAAFGVINKMPFVRHQAVDGVGDEAARIDQINGLAARRGDRGVLVFVRGGTLGNDRRYGVAAEIAKWALSGSTAPAASS
jgi:hypothetical protein